MLNYRLLNLDRIDAWNSRADKIILPFYSQDHVVEDITAGAPAPQPTILPAHSWVGLTGELALS